MPKFEITIPHSLDVRDAHNRLKQFLSTLNERFHEHIQDTSTYWYGNHADFTLTIYGGNVEGTLELGDSRVNISCRIPLRIVAYQNRIRQTIEEEARKLF